ncbi:MAG TPA: DNA-formamidopyrimidine glycosylase family protein [Fimbriimonadaceae bacterium]|nr:DNA-formamidopyrimidine glycosylase family protein [Fimbriimonadaceae bacterium]
MPEFPDIELYLARIRERLEGESLEKLRIFSPFVLRSVGVSPSAFEGRKVGGVSRLGKRIVLEFEGEYFVLIHLMIAGRLQWQSPPPPEKKALGKLLLASLRFPSGQLSLIEMATRKRAAIYLIHGRQGLDEHRREGLDVFSASAEEFGERLQAQNRTLKRALTDPHTFDGIGNAYSDEILFAARLSPVRLTRSLSEEEVARLTSAAKETLSYWAARLKELYPKFPKPADVTAFRPDFAVHGRYGKPCPVCGSPVQRIVYAENETNYCAKCQNEGRLLADRSLSRLLKDDWPATLEEMMGS